jgi:hypothetical protein
MYIICNSLPQIDQKLNTKTKLISFDNRPNIKPFPKNLRMIAGDMNLRSPPKAGAKLNIDYAKGPIQPVEFTCPRTTHKWPTYPPKSDGLHGVGIGSSDSTGSGFPDVNCDGTYSPLRADIHFPSCYNPDVDPANYKGKNMDYQTNGKCPEGWVQVPRIFYEVYHDTGSFASQWENMQGKGEQPFVLSFGDPTGYGLHGDFVNGWDNDVLSQIVTTCRSGDYGMDKVIIPILLLDKVLSME